jgi:hypothetical protein
VLGVGVAAGIGVAVGAGGCVAPGGGVAARGVAVGTTAGSVGEELWPQELTAKRTAADRAAMRRGKRKDFMEAPPGQDVNSAPGSAPDRRNRRPHKS